VRAPVKKFTSAENTDLILKRQTISDAKLWPQTAFDERREHHDSKGFL
jgi:hypothetical protein